MSLRLIGGKFKNREIKTPVGILTKPTMSLMRKSVFDICQGQVEGAHFLDIFACSGAMGLEALSRGAATATFIDKDRRATSCIKQNAILLNVEHQVSILCYDAMTALDKVIKQKQKYSIVYIDPPYTHVEQIGHKPIEFLHFFDQNDLTDQNGILFLEEAHPSHIDIDKLALQKIRHKNTRKFSNSLLHQFICENP